MYERYVDFYGDETKALYRITLLFDGYFSSSLVDVLMAQAKKTQIETQKINAELNHKGALNELHDVFLAFAIPMYPYFEETCKVSGLNNLYFSIVDGYDWSYEVTYYSDHRIEFILAYDVQNFSARFLVVQPFKSSRCR